MNTPRLPLCVVKVGGSLLDWPELPRALERWLKAQPPAVHIVLCGGGRIADIVGQADRDFALGEEASHWLCIDALGLTSKLLAAMLPAARLVTTFAALRELAAGYQASLVIFDPREFLNFHEAKLPGKPLPHTWQATSDSIAARLAESLAADELVLLKSADAPSHDLAALAASGHVDAYFPDAARNVSRVQCINLRGV